MAPILDRGGAWLLDAALAMGLWCLLVCALLAVTKEARRRRSVARWAVAGLLGVFFLTLVRLDGYNPFAWWGSQAGLTSLGVPPLRTEMGRWLCLAYVIGVAAGLGWMGVGALVGAILRSRSERPRAATLQVYAELGTVPGYRHGRPPLRVSRSIRQPILLGWFRPTILIPAGWEVEGAEDRLRLALLHELEHARNGDARFGFWAGLARSIGFALPGLGWLLRRARMDQEVLADQGAARRFGGTTTYASALVGAAALRPLDSFLELSAVASGICVPLRERLGALLEPATAPSTVSTGWRVGLAGGSLAGVLLLGLIDVSLPAWGAPPPAPPELKTTRIARIELSAEPEGRPPLELPIHLGERFSVELDIWADPEHLAGLRIAGVGPAEAPDVPDLPDWHHIELWRDEAGPLLRVDGQRVPARAAAGASPDWLTLEPRPGSLGRFRHVVVRH